MANPNDPRKLSSPDTVNEILMDRVVRHLLFLTRLSTQEANWIREQLEAGLFPELTDRIAAGVNRLAEMGGDTNLITQAQSRQIGKLVKQLEEINSGFMDDLKQTLFGRLTEIAEAETDFTRRLMEKTIPVKWNFDSPSRDQLEQILKTQPFDGKPLDEWFTGMEQSTVTRLTQAIRQGMIQGEGIDAIMRRIRGTRAGGFADGVLQTTRNHAEALARSGVMHASNQANNAFFQSNSDLIKGIKIIITLDNRTCLTCSRMEAGNPYELESYPIPPYHVNCRCTAVSLTKSWRELGIDLDEAPEGTRASMNGQVPESMTYEQWLRKQPDEVIEEALGPSRAKLFKQDKLKITAFTDRQGQVLSLADIRRRESDLFDEPAPVDQIGPISRDIDEHKQQVSDYFDTLDRQQINAIADYTGSHYTVINKAMREGSDLSEMFQKTHDNLLAAMQGAPRYEGRIWRGINTDNKSLFNRFAKYEAGDTFDDKAWFSASLKKEVAQDFSSYDSKPYEIILNTRAKNGMYVANISLSQFEQEILLKPGSQFRVLSKTVRGRRITLEMQEN